MRGHRNRRRRRRSSTVGARQKLNIAYLNGCLILAVFVGIVIIGGLLFSLILTLYVIPALYTYLSREHKAEEQKAPQQAPQLANA